VHPLKRLLAVTVLASLLGSSVAWALALRFAPTGAYDVELHFDEGRLTIVLDRRAPADRTPWRGDPAMNDSDGLHDEFVVSLATLDVCSTSDAGKSANVCVPAITVTHATDVAPSVAPVPRALITRSSPTRPSAFTILRI
jgi:hypothetical protein